MSRARAERRVSERRQLNVRIGESLYLAVVALARNERRSIPQTALQLMEEGLRQRVEGRSGDHLPATDIARLAEIGVAFSWLDEEPDLYDERSGEPA